MLLVETKFIESLIQEMNQKNDNFIDKTFTVLADGSPLASVGCYVIKAIVLVIEVYMLLKGRK